MAAYIISGLRVTSDLALPGAIAAPDGADFPSDVTIARGAVPEILDAAERSGPNWQMAGDRFILRIPDIVRMELRGGSAITWQLEGEGPPADAAIFVSGSGFGLLMHQRGSCVLHASAVAVGGKAVLFCGASGAGKSTIAAALAQQGYPLLSDDQCVISGLASGAAQVHPDGRAMKLWQQAIDRLELAGQSGAAVRDSLAKFYVRPDAAREKPLPLAALYVLQESRSPELVGGGDPIAIARFNLADAAIEVRLNAYRPAMVERMGQAGLYLQAAAAIARAGGVFRLSRPLSFAAFPDVVAALQAHWHELGLGAEPGPGEGAA